MTDAEVLADLQLIRRTRNRTSMTGDEIFIATVPAEFNALDNGASDLSDKQGQWISFCGRETVDPFASANVTFVRDLFGATSETVDNLASDRVENITRLQELGIPAPSEHQISVARS